LILPLSKRMRLRQRAAAGAGCGLEAIVQAPSCM
jgi:hypothetical protein